MANPQNNISFADLERKLGDLESAHRQFQGITNDTCGGQGLWSIEEQIDVTTKIYSSYVTIVANLENICSSIGIPVTETLFRNYYNDLIIQRSIAKKYSLGVFIVKQTNFHLVIPIKIAINSKLDIAIYKPIIINQRFDSTKKIDIIELDIFGHKGKFNRLWCRCGNLSTCNHHKEPEKIIDMKVSNKVKNEFTKPHIAKIKAAIESAIVLGQAPVN
jgi:hypothetical protein